jgi:hypothetical protein
MGATQRLSGMSSHSTRQRGISLRAPYLSFRLKFKASHKFEMEAVNSLVGTLSITTNKNLCFP